MSLWRQLRFGLRSLAGRDAADRDAADEVAHFLEEAAAERRAQGLSAEEARRAAALDAGSAFALEEQIRTAGWEASVDTVAADIRYGARRLRRRPLATALAVLTLGLGIGASTAIFSAAHPVLFEPLPYADADRSRADLERPERHAQSRSTFAAYREVIKRSRSLVSAAVVKPCRPPSTVAADRSWSTASTSAPTISACSACRQPSARDLQAADDRPRAPFVVIHQRRPLAPPVRRRSRRASDGRSRISGTPVTVIGVMPPTFENVLSPSAEFWSALEYDPALPPNGREWGSHLRMVGRLRQGVAPAQAHRELNEIARAPITELPRPAWADLRDGFITAVLQDEVTRAVRPALVAILERSPCCWLLPAPT